MMPGRKMSQIFNLSSMLLHAHMLSLAYVKLIAWHKLNSCLNNIFRMANNKSVIRMAFKNLKKKKKSCHPRDLNPGFFIKLFKSFKSLLKKSKTNVIGN